MNAIIDSLLWQYGVNLIMLVYFAPYVNAVLTKNRHVSAIAALNLLLGWTLIGWVVALSWSFMDQPSEPNSI